MKRDAYGQIILNEDDLQDFLMTGGNCREVKNVIIEKPLYNFGNTWGTTGEFPDLTVESSSTLSVTEFDIIQQSEWNMPDEYKNLNITEYVLSQCQSDAELQRCGEELLLYMDLGLIELLKYLKFLVDTMRDNDIIWGVGRGSSVASYVLFKIGVHRIDSMYYDIDISEFLRTE